MGEDLRKQVQELQQQLQNLWETADEAPLGSESGTRAPSSGKLLEEQRTLKGHYGKIYALHWSPDSRHLCSASQDGNLIVWNAFTSSKLCAIQLRSSWVMTCCTSYTNRFVASGGLDNVCSIYKVPYETAESEDEPQPIIEKMKPSHELCTHEGYVSCCRFVGSNDEKMLTSSGDSTVVMWDVQSESPSMVFKEHNGDVMSISTPSRDNSDFVVTGSTDMTAKMWDTRVSSGGKGNVTFGGHESDVNGVAFFPDGKSFVSGGDDSKCILWDLRSTRPLQQYTDMSILNGVTCVASSGGGKYIFAGLDGLRCVGFDTLTGQMVHNGNDGQHLNRVSCIGVSEDGQALCTGSWDTTLKIFA